MSRDKRETFEEIKNFINQYWQRNGVSPTTREIADGVSLPRATVGRYLVEMKEQGIIEYNGRRDFRTREQAERWDDDMIAVPIIGSIACGLPNLAEQNIEEYVNMPGKLIGKGKFYLLRAHGDSMVNVGITNGDLVLIRAQNVAEYGQIIVAQVGDEDATLKTYQPDYKNDQVVLHPENDEMDDIVVDITTTRFAIQGVARDVIHRLP